MNTFETFATVELHGEIRVGVPFAPGTEVEVTIRERDVVNADSEPADVQETRVRMKELFSRLRGRNTEPVGPLHREELYDRQVLR